MIYYLITNPREYTRLTYMTEKEAQTLAAGFLDTHIVTQVVISTDIWSN